MVAKGHHFPNLATVGIVDGDLGLAQGADPRAGERTFQLLHQVTGRAGRALALGRGYVQTHMPDHPVMEAIISGDREAFLEREIAIRRAGLLPPFGRLVALDRGGARQGDGAARRPRHRASGAAVREDRGAGSGGSAAGGRSAGGIAGGCWSRRRARSTCRPICAPGSPPCRRSRATCASRSTSIPTASCESSNWR